MACIEQSHRKNSVISNLLAQMAIVYVWGKDICLNNIRWHFLGLTLDELLNGAVFLLCLCAEKLTFLAFFAENYLKINEKFIFCKTLIRKWRHFKCNFLTRILAYSRHELIVWHHFHTLFMVWHSTKVVSGAIFVVCFLCRKDNFANTFLEYPSKNNKNDTFWVMYAKKWRPCMYALLGNLLVCS